MLVLLTLLVVPQAVLYGPSLFGDKVLLPLDILRQPGVFLPLDAPERVARPLDPILADLVFELEGERRYAVEAVRAGRLPLWNPLIYAGTPFLAANHTSVFYPLRVVDYLFPGPRALAWRRLLESVLGGVGAYLFLRVALGIGWWPAALGAALWPVCGFLVLWTGFTIGQVGVQLPWMLLAVDGTIRRPRSAWPVGLAVATAVSLVSGHAAVSVHVLLASALYVGVRLLQPGVRVAAACGAIGAGWLLGVLLSGPQTLPTLEYMRDSWRIQQRQQGRVETPPVGIAALPGVVMPYWDGSTQRHTVYLLGGNRPEGSPAASVGMLALLVLAPLGFGSPRHRRMQGFWLAVWLFGLGQVLDVPLLARLFDLPVLNTLRNNRLTFVSAWAAVAMAATGLDALRRGDVRWRPWCWLAVAGLAGIAVWAVLQPVPFALVQHIDGLRNGTTEGAPPVDTVEAAEAVARWFTGVRRAYAALAGAAALAWLAIRVAGDRRGALAGVLGVAALVEVVVQSYGVSPQFDRAWYFPPVELYERLRALGPGRVCGGPGTLPASLAMTQGLADVRGYDAADPARMIELLQLFPHRLSPPGFDYAAVQYWVPSLDSPLVNLVGMRWFVTAGPEPARTVLGEKGFWVQENRHVLPRAFVPRTARVANDRDERLRLLGARDFDPAGLVLLESTDPVPDAAADGDARIVVDEPEHVAVDLEIRAPGYVVLADRWAPGWEATVDGTAQPVLIADHAFRAVRVEAGARRLEFHYRPASFRLGLATALAAAVALAAWAAATRYWL